MASDAARDATISKVLARILVLVAGAVVLVVETLAARLVAPYVGLTLESQTAAIGIALLGIAAGSAVGGRLADVVPPRAVVIAGFGAGGALVFLIRPLIHSLGPGLPPGATSAVVAIAMSTLAPVIALSLVPPAVVKLRLRDLRDSGRTVGSLSAYGTVGALGGTFLTGFVFVAELPTGTILAVAGAICLAMAAAAAAFRTRTVVVASALAIAGAALTVRPGPCDVETAYYCARVQVDRERDGGRWLFLDDLPHSYVDLDDPTYLQFRYIQRFASAIDATFPPRRPLSAVHVGGGAFTMPRWLAATRPGTRSTALEIDRTVVSLGRARLGVASIPGLDIVVGDARTSLRRRAAGSADVVVADAFGSRSVPWHLATREFVADIRRLLRPDGLLVVNVIDNDPLAFLRAEAATVATVFAHLVLVARPEQLERDGGGNFVLVASDQPIDRAALAERLEATEPGSVVGEHELRSLIEGAPVLSDDFSPVDQLLTPY